MHEGRQRAVTHLLPEQAVLLIAQLVVPGVLLSLGC